MSTVASSPDFAAIITNVGVAVVTIGTSALAIWKAKKKIAADEDAAGLQNATKLVGGAIMDSTTMLMWSETNRDVVAALHENTRQMVELRFAITQLERSIK